jgi:hypothetical protein
VVLLVLAVNGPAAARVPRLTKPGPPTGVVAQPLEGGAAVSWTAPASDGGSPITGYAVIVAYKTNCTTDGATTCTVTGLTDGRAYTAHVRAFNSIGESKSSVGATFTAGQGPDCANLVPGADLRYCDYHDARLLGVDVAGADLTGAKLDGADLNGADLAGVNFGGDSLRHLEDLTGVIFSNANLSGANMDRTYLFGSPMDGANVTDARFASAFVIGVDFSNAILTGADLRDAQSLEYPTWSNTTCPDGTNSTTDGGTCTNNLG